MAFSLFSEVGRDLSPWPTAAHFASWLALCPDNDISGGRVLWKGVRKVNNRAGQLFRLAAHALHRSPTPLGDYLRRMKARLGPAAATTATAHKIAPSSSTPWFGSSPSMTRPSGPLVKPNATADSRRSSNARPTAWAMNWSRSIRRRLPDQFPQTIEPKGGVPQQSEGAVSTGCCHFSLLSKFADSASTTSADSRPIHPHWGQTWGQN
jgi:hypothetical protein